MTSKKAFEEKLKESALTLTDAKKLCFQLLSPEQTNKLTQRYKVAGFKIPYFSPAGRRLKDIYRIRFLENPLTGFKALTDTRPVRYTQPAKQLPEIYLPPFISWAKLFKNSGQPLYITEGELKSACATKAGLPTIGLGGVWNWKSKAKNIQFLQSLMEVSWQNREVYILFDSDSKTNPLVQMAQNALARELIKHEAIPYIIDLPAVGGEKTGIDDYIVSQGINSLINHIEQTAEEYQQSQALRQMSEEVTYVRNPGIILRLDNRQRISADAFKNHAYSNYLHEEQFVNGKTGDVVTKEVGTAAAWLKWSGRSQVESLVYEPGKDLIVKGDYNVWPGWGFEPKKGDVSLWKELVANTFNKNKQCIKWFEQWLAYPIQHPGVKLTTCVLLWGLEQGTGKSLIGYSMLRLYGQNGTEVMDNNLYMNHNEWAENKQFIMGDEITGGDKRAVADRMKSLITRKVLWINPKYIPTYSVRDCINYLFTSNHPDSAYLENETERRTFVFEVINPPLEGSFYTEYEAWVLLSDTGPPALMHYLLNVDLSDFSPKQSPPMTQAKMEMLQAGRSDVGDWVHQLKENPEGVLKFGEVPMLYSLWRVEDLLMLYDPDGRKKVTANGMARELKRAGFNTVNQGRPLRTKTKGQIRAWAIIYTRDYRMCKGNGAKLGKLYDKERSASKKERKY